MAPRPKRGCQVCLAFGARWEGADAGDAFEPGFLMLFVTAALARRNLTGCVNLPLAFDHTGKIALEKSVYSNS
jgi:hypothetical protein